MKKILKLFNSVEEIIAASLFGVMCLTVLAQMFSRIFLGFIHMYLLYWSVQFFEFQSVVKSAAMEIPMSVVAASMVLGFFLGSIRCLVNMIHYIRQIGKSERKGEA